MEYQQGLTHALSYWVLTDPQSAIWKITDGWEKNSADIRISRIIKLLFLWRQ